MPTQNLLSDAAYLHHWLSVTIHFNRYNLCFDKYTECRDKCKSLYFIVLHIRVVPPLFSPFVECPLSDTRYWVIGYFRRYVTERLLNTKVVVFLGFLCLVGCFLFLEGCWWGRKLVIRLAIFCGIFMIRLKKCRIVGDIRWKKCNESDLFAWKNVIASVCLLWNMFVCPNKNTCIQAVFIITYRV